MAGMMDQFGFMPQPQGGSPFGSLPQGINPQQANPALIAALLARQQQEGQSAPQPSGMVSPYAFAPQAGSGMGQSVPPGASMFGQMPPSSISGPPAAGSASADMPAPQAANAGPAPVQHNAGAGFSMPGGDSFESIQRKRKFAEAMMQQGMSSAPVQSWTQGANRLAQGLLGGYMAGKADKTEKEQSKQFGEAMMRALGGQTAAANQPSGASQAPASGAQPAQGTLAAYAQAVAKVESGGRYDAMGPQTRTGDRAYGKYQVMGANIPQWTKEVLGQSMTPQQFLANPQAQDAVFNQKFGGYMAKYGNPNDAVSMWFSGKPLSAAGNRSDGYNTVPQYLRKVTAALPGGAQAAIAQASPQGGPQAPQAAPGGMNPQAMMIAAALNPSLSPQQKQTMMAVAQMQAQQGKTMTVTPGQVIGRMTPQGFQQLYRAPDKEDKTSAQKDYEAYRQQVPQGQTPMPFMQYQETLKRAGSAQPENSFNVEMAKGQAKGFTEMAGEFAGARTDIANIKQLRAQLDKLPGGMMGNAQAMAVRMGIKVGPNASAIEAADAILNRLTPAQRQGMPGAASDRDVAMFRGALPTLGQTKEGQKTILDTMESLAGYKLGQAQIAQQVAMGRMTPQAALEALNKLPDPFEAFRAMQGQQTTAAPAATPQAGALPSGWSVRVE